MSVRGESSVKFAGDDNKAKIYEPKQHKKVIRLLTVMAYVFSVSLAAILLSLYYVFLWDPKNDNDKLHLSILAGENGVKWSNGGGNQPAMPDFNSVECICKAVDEASRTVDEMPQQEVEDDDRTKVVETVAAAAAAAQASADRPDGSAYSCVCKPAHAGARGPKAGDGGRRTPSDVALPRSDVPSTEVNTDDGSKSVLEPRALPVRASNDPGPDSSVGAAVESDDHRNRREPQMDQQRFYTTNPVDQPSSMSKRNDAVRIPHKTTIHNHLKTANA